MLKTRTTDAKRALSEIDELERNGCELVRVAVPDKVALEVLSEITKAAAIPIIADVHFDWRLALGAIEAGVAKVRVNPGNIGSRERFREVVLGAKKANVALRIGANSGSLHPRYQGTGNVAQALVTSLLDEVAYCEELGFENLVLSVKSSSVTETVAAYRLLAKEVDYPLHLGITEAGPLLKGAVKSAVGIAILLEQGIGDTIRVSLTAEPSREVEVAYQILQALGLWTGGPELISCPTCGRCEIDLIPLAEAIERYLSAQPYPMKVAVMGCVVNGPGEAREADLGIAAGKGTGLLFRRGQSVRKLTEETMVPELISEIEKLSAAQRLAEGDVVGENRLEDVGQPQQHSQPVVQRQISVKRVSCPAKE